ncbi:MAG: glycosyltransferase family 2 protein [Elusimicrobia bacterium]|nr:glycosyltransferase family 2 protein [Elusimicrobiota bacterium]
MVDIFLNRKINFLFTVILPSYNRAAMLMSAIQSVLWQTCQDFECVVLDDGSTDDTPKLFEKFAHHQKVRWHRFPQNHGQHFCRNYAIRRSAGKFITFLDSDDVWLPTRLEEFKKAVETRPEVGFWFSNAYLWRYDRMMGTLFDPQRPIPEGKVPGYYAVGEKHLPYVTTNLAIAREAFHEVGLFRQDLRILEDTELYARMLRQGTQVGVLRAPLAVRRLHDAQLTHDYERDFEESLVALKSGGASAHVERRYRREMALQTAVYLWKSRQPRRAREFLKKCGIPHDRQYYQWYLLSFLPPFVLGLFRWIRKIYLKKKSKGDHGSQQFKDVEILLQSVLVRD